MKNLFTAFLSMFIVACSTPEKNANSKIEIYDDSVLDIIDIYSEIEELADSISFVNLNIMISGLLSII